MTNRHKRFNVGSRVRLSQAAIDNENYQGQAWFNDVMIVRHIATAYMPAKQFFAAGMPRGYHPGYDSGIGEALYDLTTETGDAIGSSLYDWELRPA